MSVDGRAMLAVSAQLSCAGILIQSLEIVWHWRELGDRRLFGWPDPHLPAGPVVSVIRRLERYPWGIGLLAARAGAAAGCLLLPFSHPATWWLLVALVLLQLYYNRRFTFMGENANVMYLMGLGAVVVGASPGASNRLVSASLLFMAFQVLFAYAMAGRYKLRSAHWRNGQYLVRAFELRGELMPAAGAFLARHLRVAGLLTWGAILLQLLFPLCLLLPPGGFWVFAAGGVLFHATITIAMGPHAFWWSFLAMYPALWFARGEMAGWWRGVLH